MLGTATIAVDFDGTLVQNGVEPLAWRPNAKAFLVGAAAAGVQVWLHTCRATPSTDAPESEEAFWRTGEVPPMLAEDWRRFEEMRGFLEREGVYGLVMVWAAPGKPLADRYYDDRAERPDWLAAAAELGVTLGHADGRTAPQMGQPPGGPAPAAAVVAAPVPVDGDPAGAPGGDEVGS